MSGNEEQAAQRLESLLNHVEGVGARLSLEDVRQLAHLYRLNSARLAILRSRDGDPEALRYINALCVRAYTHLRVKPPSRRALGGFFMADLPTTLAATARLQLIAGLLLLAGILVGATLVSQNPAALYACIPANMYPPERLEQLANSVQEQGEFLKHTQLAFGLKSIFSASLFVHNMQVGLAAFATGILAGAPTVVLVFYNGITLGAFAWIFSRGAAWPAFLAWILPHGIPELLAVNLCSAAGLLIGKAVVAPGRSGSGAALRAAARPALELVTASLPLFVAAAVIESFLRQSLISTAARYAAAAAALAVIVAYIWYVRRLMRRHSEIDLDWLFTEGQPGGLQDSGSAQER